MTQADRLARSFGRSLQSYGQAAKVQRVVARGLARELVRAGAGPGLPSVLEFGVGTGALTRALDARFRVSNWVLNDLFPDAVAAAPVPARALIGPIERQDVPLGVDLIASASTMQWVADPAALMARLSAALAPKGWLALSTFGPNQFRELRALGSQAQAPSYLSQAGLVAGLPEGMRALNAGTCAITLWFQSPRDVLRHLRDTGVNGRAQSGWTRARLAQFEAAYHARFEKGGQVPLTYDVVWMIARKA